MTDIDAVRQAITTRNARGRTVTSFLGDVWEVNDDPNRDWLTCWECGREGVFYHLQPGEPATFITAIVINFGEPAIRVLCDLHAQLHYAERGWQLPSGANGECWWTYQRAWACEGCARLLRGYGLRLKRRHCSDNCGQRHRRKSAAQPCEVCETVMTDKRSDARHCSGACRQKAYRLRKAGG